MKHSVATLLFVAVLAALFTSAIFAGGPSGAVGTTPRKYPSNAFPLSYRTDQGGLGAFSNTTATAIANHAFAQWDSVPTAALSFTNAGQLTRNVTSATDAYISGNGQFTDGVNPVIFDSSGAITDAKLGTGAKNAVLGFAGSAFSGTSYVEGYAIINGNLSGSGSTNDQDYYKATITHEIGHFLGLGHSQVTLHGDYATLYPAIQKTTQKNLSSDDSAAISLLYPASGYTSSVGSITGTVKRPNNSLLSGVNVIAMDSVSGATYSTVVDYFSGPDSNRFVSRPTATGAYAINGLPPGRYFVRIEPLKTEFTGGSSVASYSPPVNTTVVREWYNAGSESGDMLQDNINQKVGVTVTANSTASGVNFVANESSTLSAISYNNGLPYYSFALPQGSTTKYATRFTAPSNGSLVGVKFRVGGNSVLPLTGTLTISVHANTSGSIAGIPAATALGSVTIPFSDITTDMENEVWLRGIGTAVNFNSGDDFHIVFSTSGGGSLVMLVDSGATTQNRSSHYTSASGWRNFPQGGYSAGYNFLMTAVYSTSAAGNPQPAVSLNPASLDFGRKRPGDSLDKTIVLTNSGQAALNVTGTAITGADSASFRVVGGGGTFSLTAGTSRTITLRFKPITAGGSKSAALSIVSNASTSPNSVPLVGVGVEPTASSLTTAIAFGGRRTGGTYDQTISIIRNTGNDTLHISSLALSGADAGDFTIVSATGASILAPDSTLRVSLRYQPTQRRTSTATLTVNHDATSSPSTFSVTGSGLAPVVTTAGDTIRAGNVRVAATRDTTFVVRNTGDAPLIISGATISGSDSASFTLVAPTTFPATVAAGDSLVIRVRFAPMQRRSYTATLRLTHDASPATSSYVLTGRGVAPVVDVKSVVDAGDAKVGSTHDAPVLVIRNSGDAALTITAADISGAMAADFTVVTTTPVLPATVAPGDSLTLQVRFQPLARGTRTATLTITSDALGAPTVVTVQGNGLQGELSATPSAIDYGDVLVGTPRTRRVKLVNTGNAPVSITTVVIDGIVNSPFTFASGLTLPTVILPGDSLLVDVLFTPANSGSFAGFVSVANDGIAPSIRVDIAGRGVMPGLALSRSTYAFGQVPVNTSRQMSFFVMNTGTAPLSGVTVQIEGSTGFELSPSGPFPVQPGDSVEVTVTLKPQSSPGTVNAVVKIASTGGSASEVALSATIVTASVETVAAIDFGRREVGSTVDTTFAVRNTGPIPVRIDSIVIGGASSPFVIVAGGATTIAPGDSTAITARFMPISAGSFSSLVTIHSDAGDMIVDLHGSAESIAGVASGVINAGGLRLTLLPVVPNPVSNGADVSFSVVGTGRVPVLLTLVDMRGDVVATLFDGVVEANAAQRKHLRLDAGGLQSGDYYLIMKVEGTVTTRRIVVVR